MTLILSFLAADFISLFDGFSRETNVTNGLDLSTRNEIYCTIHYTIYFLDWNFLPFSTKITRHFPKLASQELREF